VIDEEDAQLRWAVHGSRTVYDSPWVRVELADVEPPDGSRFEHHVLYLPGVAIALIVDQGGRILMLWRHRFAVDQWGYELLGGIVEAGEDPAQTAAREAEEESGWRPTGTPEHLIRFEPMPGMINGPVDVYMWRAAEKVGEPTDCEEVGRVEWVEPGRLQSLADQGALLGSGTLVAVLFYLNRMRSASPSEK
jgi:8-oxo-dGTP pyrophosphatase MutT (NUDIX family)